LSHPKPAAQAPAFLELHPPDPLGLLVRAAAVPDFGREQRLRDRVVWATLSFPHADELTSPVKLQRYPGNEEQLPVPADGACEPPIVRLAPQAELIVRRSQVDRINQQGPPPPPHPPHPPVASPPHPHGL